MLAYPFEFSFTNLFTKQYEFVQQRAYILDANQESTFSILLQNNRIADYLLLDKDFKIISKLSPDANNSALIQSKNLLQYSGGTVNGKEYRYVYYRGKNFQMETVDFAQKKISHKELFEIDKAEILQASFSQNNIHITLASCDRDKELLLYLVNDKGELTKKNIPFKVPAYVNKKRSVLSLYLKNLQVIKNDEEPDFSSVIESAKLFCQPGRLDLLINDGSNPAHVFTISIPDLQATEKFIDYSSITAKEDKEDVYINSYLKGNKLFSLALNKKNIRIVTHDLQTGNQLYVQEINEETDLNTFAAAPVTDDYRWGSLNSSKEIGSAKKLIAALTKDNEGLMVTENTAGQLIIIAGTYNLTPISMGTTTGGPVGYHTQNNLGTISAPRYYATTVSRGFATSELNYKKTYFKILLDPSTHQSIKGSTSTISDQINEYIKTIKFTKAASQLSVGTNHYYGYYDHQIKSYIIEQITIK